MHVEVMEHLRNNKVSEVDFQTAKDLLDSKAAIKDVNAALSQVCCMLTRLLGRIKVPARYVQT